MRVFFWKGCYEDWKYIIKFNSLIRFLKWTARNNMRINIQVMTLSREMINRVQCQQCRMSFITIKWLTTVTHWQKGVTNPVWMLKVKEVVVEYQWLIKTILIPKKVEVDMCTQKLNSFMINYSKKWINMKLILNESIGNSISTKIYFPISIMMNLFN